MQRFGCREYICADTGIFMPQSDLNGDGEIALEPEEWICWSRRVLVSAGENERKKPVRTQSYLNEQRSVVEKTFQEVLLIWIKA